MITWDLISQNWWPFVLMVMRLCAGKSVGAFAFLEEFIGRQITRRHCIIHLQVLCSKVLKFEHVLSMVVSIVNYVHSTGLKHGTLELFFKR
jgi:hypothetical protein